MPGSGPDGGHSHSVCTVDHAEKTWAAYRELLNDPGPVIIGAMPMASCFGPAHDFNFIVNTDLRRRRLRHEVPMTYVTSKPNIGQWGRSVVGDSKSILESEPRNGDVKWITNAKVTKIDARKMFVTEVDAYGQTVEEHELPFKFSMMLPAFKGVDAVATAESLCSRRGSVIVAENQRGKKYRNIYSAGACIAIPPVEVTSVPTAAPKTGDMIDTMVTAIVKNLVADIAAKPATAKGTWNAICLADMGSTGAAFVAIPQLPPRSVNWFRQGRWVHWAGVGFETYFICEMQRGHSEPLYGKYMRKALGIRRRAS